MKSLVVLSLALILLFGCAGNQPSGGGKMYENNTTQPAQPTPQPPPQQPSGGGYGYGYAPPAQNNSQNNTELAPSVSDNASNNSTPGVMTADYVPPKMPTYNFSNATTSDGRLIVYYFFSPRCEASVAIRPVITALEGKYPNLDWQEYDITTWNGTDAYIEFANEYNLSVQKRLVPQVLVDGRIITDRFNINSSLEGVILNYTTSTPSASRAGAS